MRLQLLASEYNYLFFISYIEASKLIESIQKEKINVVKIENGRITERWQQSKQRVLWLLDKTAKCAINSVKKSIPFHQMKVVYWSDQYAIDIWFFSPSDHEIVPLKQWKKKIK